MTTREKLDQNIPREVITTRTQAGKSLSYLETWYVIDRLNQVLGTENWSWVIQRLEPIPGDKIGFICHGVLSAVIDGKQVHKTGLGYGSDKGTFNAGEMASKEAESDSLKRAAMKFGRSLGLALYDKSQEFVDEANETKPQTRTAVTKPTDTKTTIPTATASKPITGTQTNNTALSTEGGTKTDTKILRTKLKSAFEVLSAQKKITGAAFKTKYLEGNKLDGATDAQVINALNLIKSDFKELPI